jgi:hypothetical protein
MRKLSLNRKFVMGIPKIPALSSEKDPQGMLCFGA